MKCDVCKLEARVLLRFETTVRDRFGVPRAAKLLGCVECWRAAGKPDVPIAELEAAFQRNLRHPAKGAA